MLELEPEKSLAFWIFTAAHAIESSLNEELAPLGITIRQVQILGTLAMRGEASQTEIAECLHVEPSSVVRLLDRMERDGWIARRADPDDRRRKIVRVTEKAEPVWEQIMIHGGRVKRRALETISDDDFEVTQRTLMRIRENLLGEAAENCPAIRRMNERVGES